MSSFFVDDFAVSTYSSVQSVEGQPEHSQSSTDISPLLNRENHSTACVFPMALSLKAVLGLHMFTKLFSLVEVKLHANVFLYLNKPLECFVLNLTCTAVNTCQESGQRLFLQNFLD
jgi:hypothetical protein